VKFYDNICKSTRVKKLVCFCLREEWSLLMAEYCKAGGDCGNDQNLLGKFNDRSFEMKRSASSVGFRNVEKRILDGDIYEGFICRK
jgi:hypothetical protein